MKILPLFAAVLLVFAACAGNHGDWNPEKIKRDVLAKERQANDQWSAGQPSGFSAHFAADVTWFDDIAAQSRIAGLEKMNQYFKTLEGKVPAHTYKMVKPMVQIYGETAIVTYQYHSTMPNGQPGPPWKTTSVYHLQENGWKVVHAHWSLVNKQNPEEPIPKE